jgi:hypothetical protein
MATEDAVSLNRIHPFIMRADPNHRRPDCEYLSFCSLRKPRAWSSEGGAATRKGDRDSLIDLKSDGCYAPGGNSWALIGVGYALG